MKKKKVCISIDEFLIEEAKSFSDLHATSFSGVVREALKVYLEQYEPPKVPIFRLKHTEYNGKF